MSKVKIYFRSVVTGEDQLAVTFEDTEVYDAHISRRLRYELEEIASTYDASIIVEYTTCPFEAFEEALKKHDWFYQFSDDHSVWQAGSAAAMQLAKLRAAASKIDKERADELYSQYEKTP